MSVTATDRYHALLDFLAWHNIFLHPSLRISHDGDTAATTIYATSAIFASSTTVARVPKRTLLSCRTSSFRVALPPPEDPAVHLALCVLHEQMLGPSSVWAAYLSLLPPLAPLGLLWEPRSEARAWAKGTELDRVLSDSAISLDSLRETYLRYASHIPTLPSDPSRFLHAYALVSSRAFQADAYHGLSMAPLLDLFDHRDPPHVHVETEHWVCSECGKLWGCVHDEDTTSRPIADKEVEHEEEDTLDLVSSVAIAEGEEVFNTYGPGLSSAQLVASYGFLPSANPSDTIRFALLDLAADLGPDVQPPNIVHWDPSMLDEEYTDLVASVPIRDPQALFIDADARLSPALFLLLRPDRDLATLEAVLQRRCAATRNPDLGIEQLFTLAENEADVSVRMAIELLAGERVLLQTVRDSWRPEDREAEDE